MPNQNLRVGVLKRNATKRYVKLIAVCKDPKLYKELLHKAPDPVIKSICNAAINALRGEIHLTPANKKLFTKHKKLIEDLSTRQVTIKSKRKLLNQKGNGLPLIPLILSTVLSSLGSLIFDKLAKK
jgi:hypothetical protein